MQIFPGLVESVKGTSGHKKTEKKNNSDMFSLLLGRVSTEKTQGKRGSVVQKVQAELFSRLSAKNGFAKGTSKSLEQAVKADAAQKVDLANEAFVSAMSFFLNLLAGLETAVDGKSASENGFLGVKESGDGLPKKDVYKGVLAELRLLLQQKGAAGSKIQDVLAELERAGKSVEGKISFGALKETILAAWKDALPKDNNSGKAISGKNSSFENRTNSQPRDIVAQGRMAKKNVLEISGGKQHADLAASFEKQKGRVTHSDLKVPAGVEEEHQETRLSSTARQPERTVARQKITVSGEAAKTASPKDAALPEKTFGKLEELLGDIKSRLEQVLTKSGLKRAEAKQLGERIFADLRGLRLESGQPEKASRERLVPLGEIGRLASLEKGGKVAETKTAPSQQADKHTQNSVELKRADQENTGSTERENLEKTSGKVKSETSQTQIDVAAKKQTTENRQTRAGENQTEAKDSEQARESLRELESKKSADAKAQKQAQVKPDAAVKDQSLAKQPSGMAKPETSQAGQESDGALQGKETVAVGSASADSRPKKMVEREQAKAVKAEFQSRDKESLAARNIEDMTSGSFDEGENFSSSRQDMFAREHGRAEAPQPTQTNEKSFRLPTHTVARQIEQGAFKNLQPGTKQLVLQLNPAALGSVMVMLRVNKDKEVHAVLRTGNHEAARVIGEQAQQLRQSLESQGLKVSRLDVEHDAGLRSDSDSGTWQQQQNRQESDAQQGFRDRLTWRAPRKNELETDVSAVLEHELQHTVYQENFSSGVDIFA